MARSAAYVWQLLILVKHHTLSRCVTILAGYVLEVSHHTVALLFVESLRQSLT